jgi:UDP-glucose 4-epimerase/UDP-glucuronate decarboxylase
MNADLQLPLVTGAGGFIGRNLVLQLAKDPRTEKVIALDMPGSPGFALFRNDPKVHIIEADLSRHDFEFGYKQQPTSIFMLAAMNGTGRFYSQPWDVLMNSTLPTINIINRFQGTCPMLYTSSSEVYASTIATNEALVPTDEEISPSIEDIHNPRWSYATAKLLGEVALQASAIQHGTRGVIIRYHNVYGPDMGVDHFVPDFIQKVKEGKFEIIGAEETRAFLHISDAISGTIAAIEHSSLEVPIFHLGTEEELEISQAAEIILEEMGLQRSKLNFLPSRIGSVKRRVANISKARQILKWEPDIDFRSGIHKFLKEDTTK